MITLKEFASLETKKEKIQALEDLYAPLTKQNNGRKERSTLVFKQVGIGKRISASWESVDGSRSIALQEAPREELIFSMALLGYWVSDKRLHQMYKDKGIGLNCEKLSLRTEKKTGMLLFKIGGTASIENCPWGLAFRTDWMPVDAEENAIVQKILDEAYLYITGERGKENE